MTGRRELAVAVGLVGLGALVALLAGARATTGEAGQPSADGRSVTSALGLVCLVGAGALPFLGRWARQIVAMLLCALGVGVVVSALGAGGAVGWTWLATAAGVAIAAGGLLTVLRCARWPAPGGGDQSGRSPSDERGAPGARDTWDALDRGEDPTG